MQSKIAFQLIFLCMMMGIVGQSQAQEQKDSTALYKVETTDGNVYVGKIVSRDENQLILKTDNLGELTIHFRDVREVKEIAPQDLTHGEVWPENPHSTRYFYLPNGYGLKQGEGYYQNTWVLFNQVSYGFTNNFSLGAGLIPTFLFGADGFPFWITPKVTIPVKKDKWNLGAGAIIGKYFDPEDNDSPFIGLLYGVSTFGSREKNVTLGVGYAFADGDISSTPILTLGGTIQTGRRHFLLSENYFIVSDGEMVTMMWLGGRFASLHVAIDYGLIIPISSGMNNFVAIPWLGLTVPFGQKQKAYLPE